MQKLAFFFSLALISIYVHGQIKINEILVNNLQTIVIENNNAFAPGTSFIRIFAEDHIKFLKFIKL